MSTSDKKMADVRETVERLRKQNKKSVIREESSPYIALPPVNAARKRVSDGKNRVDTQQRKTVMNAIIKRLLFGEMTQGEALKRLRIDVLGLQQAAYADLVSVSRKTLSEIENDKGNYSVEIVNKAFKPFGLVVGLVPASKTLLASLLE